MIDPFRATGRPVKKARFAFLLPLAGYVIYLSEAAFGRPNPIWASLLLSWTLGTAALGWWLTRPEAERLLQSLDRKAGTIAITIIVLVALTFVAGSVLQARYFAAGAQTEDTAYYSQVLWNTLHGNFLSGNVQQERLYSPPVTNELALHVSPVLLVVLLPIYAVFPHFLTLLILRDFALAAAAWPLFLLARERLGGAGGVAAVLLYLANPVVIAQGFDAFYLLQLAPLPFFWAVRAYVREEFGSFLLWMGIAIGVREDVAITCAGFGLWALARRRPFKWWCAGLGTPVAWWALATLVIQPIFGGWRSGGFHSALAGGSPDPLGSYHVLLTQPSWILKVLQEGGFAYLLRLLRSVAFLPLLGAEGLLAVPGPTAILFLGRVLYSALDPFSHLALLPSCALIGSTVVIVSRLGRKHDWDLRVFALIMLFLLPSAGLFNGAKQAVQGRLGSYTVRNDPQALREAIKLIPEGAPVAAPNYALPVLSKRPRLYYLQYMQGPFTTPGSGDEQTRRGGKGRWFGVYPQPDPDFILLDNDLDRVTTNPELRERYITLLGRLSRSTNYETVWQRREYRLLRKALNAPAK